MLGRLRALGLRGDLYTGNASILPRTLKISNRPTRFFFQGWPDGHCNRFFGDNLAFSQRLTVFRAGRSHGGSLGGIHVPSGNNGVGPDRRVAPERGFRARADRRGRERERPTRSGHLVLADRRRSDPAGRTDGLHGRREAPEAGPPV